MNRSAKEVTIYTDGACQSNPGPGGYGVVMITDGQRKELSGGCRSTTNNRMELLSVIRALQTIEVTRAGVTIYSDAQYVVKMYNDGHAARWQRAGWTRNKGKDPALNSDLWGELLKLCSQHDVKFIWVRGHDSTVENNRCDELAVAARQQTDLPADEAYEKLTEAQKQTAAAITQAEQVPCQQMLFEGL